MGTEIERPSEVAEIPVAPGIKLENLIQFDGDCIDPLALAIIVESLDYCLETSVRRLRSAGKIFSGVEETAYSGGKGVLPVIKAIRNALLEAPQCTRGGPKITPPIPPQKAIIAEAVKRTEEQAKTPEKAIISAKTKGELLKAVEGFPELKKVITEAIKKETPKKAEAPTGRTLPGLWGPAYYEGKEYESPQVLAEELGIKTRGARDMVVAFKRAGFKVTGNGEEVEKGKTGFKVTRVLPAIPREYRREKEGEPEFLGPGIPHVTPLRKGVPKRKLEERREEWVKIVDKDKKLLGWEPVDKEGFRIRERRILPGSKEAKEMGFE